MKTILKIIIIICLINNDIYSQPFTNHDISKAYAEQTESKTADIDNDGDLDIIVFALDNHKLLLAKNNGGTFLQPEVIDNPLYVDDIEISDMNNDGLLDILVVNSRKGALGVFYYENLSGGNFANKTLLINKPNIIDISCYDFNNDGEKDIVALNSYDPGGGYYTDTVTFHENTGNVTFGNSTVISTNHEKLGELIIKDLTNNGKKDLIVYSNYDNRVVWYENLGGGSFSSPKIITTNSDRPESISAEDIDGDGLNDIIVGSYYDDKLAWFQNLGSGVFSSEHIISLNYDIETLAVNDIDGDGKKDIIFHHATYIFHIKNLGGGNFANIDTLDDSYTPHSHFDYTSTLFIEDFNNDNKKDILLTSGVTILHENLTNTTFSHQIVISNHLGTASNVSYADIDNDGDLDILASHGAITWFENLGNGSFDNAKILLDKDVTHFSIEDLNNDGDLDIVTAEYGNDRIAWYENLGSNTFGPMNTLTIFANGASDVLTADLDNDGDLDIVFGSYLNDRVGWFENLGNNIFSAEKNISYTIRSFHNVTVDDIDGDGFLDVLAAGHNSSPKWFRNLGNKTFSPGKTIVDDGYGQWDLHTNDFDNDGDKDIVHIDWEGKTCIRENIGNGIIDTATCYYVGHFGLDLESVVSGDINGDGQMDIITASGDSGRIHWSEKAIGDSQYPNTTNHLIDGTTINATDVEVVDIDQDGDLDVLSVSISKITWHENLRLNNTTKIIELSNNSLLVYPNPTSKLINIQSNKTDNIKSISIFNILGNLVDSYSVDSHKFTIDTEKYKNGIYLLKIETSKSIYSKKVIKK
jgi:hypothetical protein